MAYLIYLIPVAVIVLLICCGRYVDRQQRAARQWDRDHGRPPYY